MLTDIADAVLWTMRLLALAGLGWGAWLLLNHLALLVLLDSTLGGVMHAG